MKRYRQYARTGGRLIAADSEAGLDGCRGYVGRRRRKLVAEEPGEERAEIRREFGDRWPGIGLEGQKARQRGTSVTEDESRGSRGGAECPFWGSG
jgi:hypothetical protein